MSDFAIENLSFKYRSGDSFIFHNLNFQFEKGALTALVGPSGSGKSTLLYVLGLMLNPSAGRVLFHGQDVSSNSDYLRSSFRSQKIGFVFQDAELDTYRPIIESVVEPGLYQGKSFGELEDRGSELLTYVGLADQIYKKPHQMSGGQGQRAAIARALINDPDIILADEPTGNLDRGNAATILDLLTKESGKGKTVIIATHDPFIRESCDCVLDVTQGILL